MISKLNKNEKIAEEKYGNARNLKLDNENKLTKDTSRLNKDEIEQSYQVEPIEIESKESNNMVENNTTKKPNKKTKKQ